MPDSKHRPPVWTTVLLSAAVGAAAAVAILLWSPGTSSESSGQPPAVAPPPGTTSLRSVAERTLHSVVSVTASANARPAENTEAVPPSQEYRADPFQNPDGSERSEIRAPEPGTIGSGWICRSDGFIATNLHLVPGEKQVTVRLQDRATPQTVPARVWGADGRTDTAVLKADVDCSLPALSLEDSSSVEIGQQVLAAGTPFGLEGSVTSGIVSAPARMIPGRNDSRLHEVIQIDAAITSGSSGGPVVNRQGRLVGMTVATARSGTAAREMASYGFAIPARTLRRVIPELIENRRVRWAVMGCTMRPLSPNLKDFYGAAEGGVLVTRCVENSPAEDAGVRPDDVIVSIGRQAIRSTTDAHRALMTHRPGETVTVGIIRDRSRVNVEIELAEAPDSSTPLTREPESEPAAGVGLEVKAASRMLLGAHGLHSEHGVAVVEVQPRSPADGIVRRGDLVLKVGGTPVADASHYRRLIDREMASDRDYIVFHLHRRSRDGSTRTVVTDIPLPEQSPAGGEDSQ